MVQVIAEMKRYKLDILGISESRWTKSGRMKTKTGEQFSSLGEKMIYITRKLQSS